MNGEINDSTPGTWSMQDFSTLYINKSKPSFHSYIVVGILQNSIAASNIEGTKYRQSSVVDRWKDWIVFVQRCEETDFLDHISDPIKNAESN